MDPITVTPQTPPPNIPEPRLNELPSIMTLFNESLTLFKQTFVKLFMLGLVNFGLLIVFLVALVVILFTTGVAGVLTKSSAANNPALLLNSLGLIKNLVIAYLIIYFLLIVAAQTLQIALILMVGKKNQTLGFWEIIGIALKKTIPVMIFSFFLGLIWLGSFFLFMLPALLVGFFMMFAIYEIILNDHGPITAIKRSVAIVGQHGVDIFVRLVIYFIVFAFLFLFIPNIMMKIDKQTGTYVGIIMFFVQIFFTWYGLCFSMTIYNQAAENTDFEKKSSVAWVWVISIIGWLIFMMTMFFVILGFISAFKSGAFQKAFDATKSEFENKNVRVIKNDGSNNVKTYVPSSCGLSIPLTNTADTYKGKDRKWYYEENFLNPSGFIVLDKDVFPVARMLGAFIGYKAEDEKLKLDSNGKFNVAYPGLNIYCVDNTKAYTLDEYVSLALSNKNYLVTKGKTYSLGEVQAVSITLESKATNDQFKDNAYLAVTKDGKRLLYIRVWTASDTDPYKKNILDDIDNVILRNLMYKNSADSLNNSPLPTVPPGR